MVPRDDHPPTPSLNIAVIGSGISGLSAAWLLSKTHTVTLFEAADRLGGHTNTVKVPTSDGPVPVDTGFIVFNERTYPNLCALFDHLDVTSVKSDMSFGVSLEGGALEYAGSSLAGLFAQPRNLISPRFWSMLRDLMQFYREAPADAETDLGAMSLTAYLDQKGYGEAVAVDHLIPMAAAIWSTPLAEVGAFPLKAFVRFCSNHGLLQLRDRPQWRTLLGGSSTYIPKLTAPVQNIRLSAPVLSVDSVGAQVEVTTNKYGAERFDRVLIASHADEALAMLKSPTEDEAKILGAFPYTDNQAVLHTDARLMPNRKAAWASWDVLSEAPGSKGQSDALCVSYWMNNLQQLDTRDDLFVTLNPSRPIKGNRILYSTHYSHPVFNTASMAAQQNLWSLQGQRGIWFAGAHFGYGFHEDGLQSGLKAAEEMGGTKRPWTRPGMNDRILALKAGAKLAQVAQS